MKASNQRRSCLGHSFKGLDIVMDFRESFNVFPRSVIGNLPLLLYLRYIDDILLIAPSSSAPEDHLEDLQALFDPTPVYPHKSAL